VDWMHIIAGILSSVVVAVLGKLLDIKLDESQRKKLDWAIEKGVSAAAAQLWKQPGEERHAAAIKTAESLAPAAMKKLTEEQKRVVVDATYARMRSSLPSPTSWSMSGAEVPHATEDLGSGRPQPRDDEDTQP
jgi:hypothetical protein